MTPETQISPDKASEVPSVVTLIEEGKSAASSSSQKISLTALAAKLPIQLDLRVPIPSFRVQNLLSLEKDQIVETIWQHTEDLPLWSGAAQLVWSEFEVVDQKLAVRVTRLA